MNFFRLNVSHVSKKIFDTHFDRGKSKAKLLLIFWGEPKISNAQIVTMLTNALQFNILFSQLIALYFFLRFKWKKSLQQMLI